MGIENGNATFWADYEAVVAQANGKEIWVTETGWPSSGPQSGEATPSVENAETYFGEVYCSLSARGINIWWYTLRDSDFGRQCAQLRCYGTRWLYAQVRSVLLERKGAGCIWCDIKCDR